MQRPLPAWRPILSDRGVTSPAVTISGRSASDPTGAIETECHGPDKVDSRESDDASGVLVRIVVRLRPQQYDELFSHVREVGSTMSAFCREAVAKAMREEHGKKVGNGQGVKR
jgi:hypothetical protein